MPDYTENSYESALEQAARLLGERLEPHLAPSPGEPANAAEFKRLATIHAFGDVWPRTDELDLRSRALTSVAIAATLGTLGPLRGQIRIALQGGASTAEVVEVLIQVAVYAGVARAFEAYGIAASVFAERAATPGPESAETR